MTFADKLNVGLCNLRYSVDLHSSTITNNQMFDSMCRFTKLIFREKFCNLKNVCSIKVVPSMEFKYGSQLFILISCPKLKIYLIQK